jgi:hypothetical protein
MEAKRLQTPYGTRVVAALREENRAIVIREFLPKRYSDVFEDSDLDAIKSKQLQYYLTYRRTSPSKSIILQIDL